MNSVITPAISPVGDMLVNTVTQAAESQFGPVAAAVVNAASKQGVKMMTDALNSPSPTAQPTKGGGSSRNRASQFGMPQPPKTPNGGDGGASRPYDRVRASNGSSFPVGRVSYQPEPYKFTLNTGIVAPVYSPTYNESQEDNSTMHVSFMNFGLTQDTFQVSNFVQSVVFQYFSNAIQAAISFSLPSYWSVSELISWFNACNRALQTYYFYKSILSYTSSPTNNNDAMLNLRNQITPNDLNNLYELERVLLGTPLPPNLVNFAWWMNQNVVAVNLPNLPVHKIINVDADYSDATGELVIAEGQISEATSTLLSLQRTSSLITRATDWLLPTLPGYPAALVVDDNWMTVFCNSGAVFGNRDGQTYMPSVDTPTTPITYATRTNTLDGAAYSLCSIYDRTNSVFLPTLMSPRQVDNVAGINCSNRFSFIDGVWTDSCLNADSADVYQSKLSISRGETYYVNQIGPNMSINPWGAQVVYNVDTSTIGQSAVQLSEWLFSIDNIGVILDNRQYRSSNKAGRRRK